MVECLVTHLRHVALAVPEHRRQVDFFTDMWGLVAVDHVPSVTFLAAEGSAEQYVVRVRKSAEKRLDLISFGAASPADIDTLAARLSASGVQMISEPATLDTPGGGYGFRFFDVDGRTVEVSADVATRRHRTIEEKEAVPVRLSHIVVNTTDIDRTLAFYVERLGMRLSDSLAGVMHFARCSPQHHSIGFARAPHAAVHHISFEMRGVDEYMRGTGRLMRAGVHKVWGPGRHLAGDNTFAYFLDPHGNTVEYTTSLAVLDEDTWQPHVYRLNDPQVADQWGTAEPMNEMIVKQSYNDPDKGLFVAPPL